MVEFHSIWFMLVLFCSGQVCVTPHQYVPHTVGITVGGLSAHGFRGIGEKAVTVLGSGSLTIF